MEAAGLQPAFKNGGPAFVVGARGKFGDVISRGVGLDAGNFAKIVHGMGGVGSASANTKDEQAPPGHAGVREQMRGLLDAGNIEFREDLDSFFEKRFRETFFGVAQRTAPCVERNCAVSWRPAGEPIS